MATTHPQTTTVAQALVFPLKRSASDWLLAGFIAAIMLELLRGILPNLLQLFILLPLTFMVWVFLFRVASETLMSAAQNHQPDSGFRQTAAPDRLALRHIGLWLLAALTIAAVIVNAGQFAAVLAGLLLALYLPAVTLILTLKNSLLDALNPMAAWRLTLAMGRQDYLRLCLLLLGLGLGYAVLAFLMSLLGLPKAALNIMLLMYWAWALLAWFFFAGRMLFEHRHELALAPADEAEVAAPVPGYSRDPEVLWQEIQTNGGTAAMHQTLARALDAGQDQAMLLAHGKMHVAVMLEAFDQPDAALLRADKLLDIDPNFALETASDMFSLIERAAQQNHSWLCAKLGQSYLANFPTSQRRNAVRLLCCESLKEETSDYRKYGERWFQQLMTEPLAPDQRQRLNDIAGFYLMDD